MILIVLLAIIWLVSYVYVKWRYTYWKRLGVPYPEPVFLFGNILETITMQSHLAILTGKWYREYSNVPYSGYYKFLKPAVNLRDADLIKDILIKDHFSFHVNEQQFDEKTDPLMILNPFGARGDVWRKGRTVLTPLLTLFKVRTIYPLLMDSCVKLNDYIRTMPPNKNIEAKALASRFATQNVIRCSFSIDAECFKPEKSEFRRWGKQIFQPTYWGGIYITMMSICPPLRDILPYGFVPANVDKSFRELVVELREERSKRPLQHEDFFQMLLNSVEKHDIDDIELAGYCLAMFVEGYETSSSVLGFAIYEMARNPDIQERLYTEITDVLAKYNGECPFEALQEMDYLDNVIHEAMRLDVVAPLISRICTKEYTLPLIKGQKEPVTLQPGTAVQINCRALHMDPQHYPDPEVFDPDRFTQEERRNRHKAVYLPFGEGPRMCTGIKFALAQTKAGLMAIVRDFKITLSPQHKPFVMDIRSFLYQARDGLMVNFTPRATQ